MSEWSIVKLKDIVTGLYDGPHATPPESNNGAIFLGIKNVTEDGRLDLSDIRHISLDDYPRWIKRVKPQGGDIVFSYEATLHRYAIIPKDFFGCLGRRMALIRVNEAIADRRFIFQYLLSNNWRREVEKNILSGATVDRIPLTNVPEFELCIPLLATQQKIASILSAYDDLIENNLKRIKLLEEIARRTYEEWFVKFRINGEELAIDEETGLPDGWEKVKCFDVMDVMSGGTPKTIIPEYWNGAIPFFTPKDASGYSYTFGTEKHVTELGVSKCNSKLFPIDTVFITARGTVGKLNLAAEPMIMNQSCYALKGRDYIGQLFLFYSIKATISQFKGAANGGVFDAIVVDTFRYLDFTKPSKQDVDSFESIVRPIANQTRNLLKTNKLLKENRDILLPRLMSREIDVEEMEIKSKK